MLREGNRIGDFFDSRYLMSRFSVSESSVHCRKKFTAMSLMGEEERANLIARGLSACIFFFIFTKAGVPYSKEYLRNRISRFWG